MIYIYGAIPQVKPRFRRLKVHQPNLLKIGCTSNYEQRLSSLKGDYFHFRNFQGYVRLAFLFPIKDSEEALGRKGLNSYIGTHEYVIHRALQRYADRPTEGQPSELYDLRKVHHLKNVAIELIREEVETILSTI